MMQYLAYATSGENPDIVWVLRDESDTDYLLERGNLY